MRNIDEDKIIKVSSKTGQGVEQLFPAIVERIRPPTGEENEDKLRALLFDSWFDQHRGVICLISIKSGQIRKGDRIATYHLGHQYEVQDLGILMPKPTQTEVLKTGQVGFLIAGMKTSKEARLGDTFYWIGNKKQNKTQIGAQTVQALKQSIEPLSGFKPSKSFVFAGLFPAQSSDFEALNAAIEKLTLNDASVHVEKESSVALGLGFRCGFLGILHMDVFSSRLEQEFGAAVIITAPTVPFQAHMKDGKTIRIDSPAKFPSSTLVDSFSEPMVRAQIIAPVEYLGDMLDLCNNHRGVMEDVVHIGITRVHIKYKLPLSEIVVDFYDSVKSLSSGYASFDYEECGYQAAELVKLDIRLNGESVDALSVVCIQDKAEALGRKIVNKLKEKVSRQQYEVIIQAAIGNRVLARERIAPFRKDV
jgi:elongation factor 4